MLMLQVVFLLAILGEQEVNDESPAVDALLPEHIIALTSRLDDASFQNREAASDQLFQLGCSAVYPLAVVAETGSLEASVRALTILQQLYRSDQESTYEAVEQSFQELKHSSNLAVAARAQQSLENNSETRQERTIAQIERLGAIVNFRDRGPDRLPLGRQSRPTIEYVVLSRSWTGGDAGLRLLGRIEDIRNSDVPLYIIRGVKISENSMQDLRAELPFLQIQYRGPARLGVRSPAAQREDQGCVVSEVEPGSAAEVAGLRPEDVIINIDQIPVGNFQGLIQIIETKEPGERVPIVFRRGQEIQETHAELQTWEKKPRISDSKPKP